MYFCVILYSCKTPEKYVVNNWRVEKLKPGTDFTASPEHMKIFEDFEKYARFEFNNDGTYTFDLVGTIQKGTWTFSRKEMTITTTDENGKVTVSKVIELTPDKLVFEQDDNGVKNVIILVPKEAAQ